MFSCDGSRRVTTETLKTGKDFNAATFQNNKRYLVNPGSVGQPRDGDNRSSFAIWDTDQDRMEFYRVAYPFQITQEKMRKVELPPYLIDRLTFGR